MPANQEILTQLGSLIGQLDAALKDPAVARLLGQRLTNEFRHPVVAFRMRFPDFMPEGQQDLFSAADEAASR
jgi:hypothetical protein